MIWVIGDIHGMFDPLKCLVNNIMELHQRGGEDYKVERLIFVGDYIDYGPSSKEVLDYLMNLPFEAEFLIGNHDELLLQFVRNSDLFERYGNVWFRGNGGQDTVRSFFPEIVCISENNRLKPEEFPLDDKYIDFFDSLKFHHRETVGGRELVFVHALFNHELPLTEQLAIESYEEFHAWRREKKVWIEDTFLWNRQEPGQRYGDFILVHGHLPTPFLDQHWRRLHGYDPSLELPFLKFEDGIDPEEYDGEGELEVEFHRQFQDYKYDGTLDRLVAINTDTGAVFGHRLTAVGLSAALFDKREIMVYQVAVGEGYRRSRNLHRYSIHFSGS